MGSIKIADIKELLRHCFDKLKKFIVNIDNLSKFEYEYFIIILAQYLYLYSSNILYPDGKCNEDGSNGECYMTRFVIRAVVGSSYSFMTDLIIDSRNLLCHEPGTDRQIIKFEKISNRNDLIPLLKHIGFAELFPSDDETKDSSKNNLLSRAKQSK